MAEHKWFQALIKFIKKIWWGIIQIALFVLVAVIVVSIAAWPLWLVWLSHTLAWLLLEHWDWILVGFLALFGLGHLWDFIEKKTK